MAVPLAIVLDHTFSFKHAPSLRTFAKPVKYDRRSLGQENYSSLFVSYNSESSNLKYNGAFHMGR